MKTKILLGLVALLGFSLTAKADLYYVPGYGTYDITAVVGNPYTSFESTTLSLQPWYLSQSAAADFASVVQYDLGYSAGTSFGLFFSYGGALVEYWDGSSAQGVLVGNTDYRFAVATAVPEGGTSLALFGAGLFALGALRRKFARA